MFIINTDCPLVDNYQLEPKNESVLNILAYFPEQFQTFSQGLQPLKNL